MATDLVGSRAPEMPGEPRVFPRGAIPSDMVYQRSTPLRSLQDWQTVTMETEAPPTTDNLLAAVDTQPPPPDPHFGDVLMPGLSQQDEQEVKILRLSELCHFPKIPEVGDMLLTRPHSHSISSNPQPKCTKMR